MEQIASETVAIPAVSALRGAERPTPVWWEAFDDEGSRGSRIANNPLPRSIWSSGATRMSIAVVPEAPGLADQDTARRTFVSHSSPIFTGLCEKDYLRPASTMVSAGGRN
jgi:hypothetical protein